MRASNNETSVCLSVGAGRLVLGTLVNFCLQAVARPGNEARRLNQAAADELFTNGVVHLLKIDIAKEGLRSLRRDARANVRATLREGSQVLTNVMIRLKGGAGSFRPIDDKPGLTLNLGDGPATFHGLKKFHLNNSVQDDTYLSEWICSEIFRQAGVPAARAAHAIVELNGRRLGLYVLLETINRDFLDCYFDNSQGNVYSCSANADVNEGLERIGGHEEAAGRDLEALAAAAREPDPERLAARLAQVLDVPRFLSFMAVERLLDHWDGYTANVKNYFVYHNLDNNKLVFLPHDMDQMLRDSQASIIPNSRGMVARAMLRCPEARTRYRERFEAIFTNVFVAPILSRRIDEQVARLLPGLRHYDAGLADQFAANADSLKDRIRLRARALAAQLKMPDPGQLKFVNDMVLVRGWRVANLKQNAKQGRMRDPSGKATLWIAATSQTTASWRAKVVLDPGHYVFKGNARSVGVKSISGDDRGQGAGLRISGSSRAQTNKLVGNSPWQKLAFEFEVTDDQPEVELICELRGQQGEVWFEEESLQLVRRK